MTDFVCIAQTFCVKQRTKLLNIFNGIGASRRINPSSPLDSRPFVFCQQLNERKSSGSHNFMHIGSPKRTNHGTQERHEQQSQHDKRYHERTINARLPSRTNRRVPPIRRRQIQQTCRQNRCNGNTRQPRQRHRRHLILNQPRTCNGKRETTDQKIRGRHPPARPLADPSDEAEAQSRQCKKAHDADGEHFIVQAFRPATDGKDKSSQRHTTDDSQQYKPPLGRLHRPRHSQRLIRTVHTPCPSRHRRRCDGRPGRPRCRASA